MSTREIPQEYTQLAERLQSLLDSDPALAVREARSLPSNGAIGGVMLMGLKAAILVDAGSASKDKVAVEEGVGLIRSFIEATPKKHVGGLLYNLGNGLVTLASLEPYNSVDWYILTAPLRREGRSAFSRATELSDERVDIACAYTNIGNSYWQASRWVEAYDAYSKALEHDHSNVIAATGAIQVIDRCLAQGIGNPEILCAVAEKHKLNARDHAHRITELAGLKALEEISRLLDIPINGGKMPDLSAAGAYEKFVAHHRLALSPTIEGLDLSLKRWDSLQIDSLIVPASGHYVVPVLFAMFNVLKADYLLARYLAYQAFNEELPDSGHYVDTLDYATYGMRSSTLLLSQRACMDILDKIAVAVTEYLQIPDSTKSISFTTRWFSGSNNRQPVAWHPKIKKEIERGNTGLIALADLSLDVHAGGALQLKRDHRNTSTHRFNILHDMGTAAKSSTYAQHSDLRLFKTQLIESLQLARAALIYFVECVRFSELGKKHLVSNLPPLSVPSHHWIRGEDKN